MKKGSRNLLELESSDNIHIYTVKGNGSESFLPLEIS